MRRLAIAALVVAAGCGDETIPPTVTGLSSIQVTMVSPTPDQLGSPSAPITTKDFVVDLQALDTKGQPFTQDIDADVYVSFAGNKIGQFTPCGDNEDSTPLQTIRLTGGAAQNLTIHVPTAYGKTSLWIEEAPTPAEAPNRMPPPLSTGSHAAGASPSIYFPNPTIPEIQTPLDPAAPEAAYCSPWNQKHVVIDHPTGKLVVTSVFINAYAVADTTANYDPMSDTGGYNHMYVFSFGRPDIAIQPGRIITDLEGNISKFVGFTELNFPLEHYAQATPDPSLMPPVVVLSPAWRGVPIHYLRLEAATVSLTGKLCTIDTTNDQWIKYNQFTLDQGGAGTGLPSSCDDFTTPAVELPAKTFGTFDPLQTPVGTKITVVGMLRNSSGQNEATTPPTPCTTNDVCTPLGTSVTCVEGSCKKGAYNFFTVSPRTTDDVTVN